MYEILNIDIGLAIKHLLKEKNMTQGDLFRGTGLERSHISRLASGNIKNPIITTMFKIANAFNISISDFIKVAEACKNGGRCPLCKKELSIKEK